MIDLNPRPGLSINILSKIYKNNLFSFENEITATKRIYATIIIYAKKKLFINLNIYNKLYKLKNSNNYSELPMLDTVINKEQPICLIHTSSLTIKNLNKNINRLRNKLFNYLKYSNE